MQAFPSAQDDGSDRVLFRVETDRETGTITLLVQSVQEPNWSMLEAARDFFLQPPECKQFTPNFRAGQQLTFRLRANPTVKRQGKRFGLMKEDEQYVWLRRKGEAGGFVPHAITVIPERTMEDKKTDKTGQAHDLTLVTVRFEGTLQITDPTFFTRTLEQGIGSGKGFGLGLLSVAPMR
jgi:CRISPR system Cascade subunit CasE